MRLFLIGTLITMVLLSAVTPLYAQKLSEAQAAKSDIKYREESEAIRKSVWAWKRTEFSKKDIPAEFSKASKVVIARHTELSADSKSKIAYYGLGVGPKKELTIMETFREMIKLNDKAAVEEYSELSFTRLISKSGLYKKAVSSAYIGVRVIKPNGKIKEIDADDMVFTKNEKEEKKAKVAIPDLQPGDIIDYFIATDQYITNDFSVKSYSLIMFDDAPVIHYSFHGQLGRKYAIDYRSYNGAPELKVSKNEDDDIVIDVERKNIPAFETGLWVAPALQLPFIRMQIALGYKGLGNVYHGLSKQGEVNKNKPMEAVLARKAKIFSEEYFFENYASFNSDDSYMIVTMSRARAKSRGQEFKNLNDTEKASEIFYSTRFYKLLKFDIEDLERSINIGKYQFNGLPIALNSSFSEAQLETGVILSPSRNGYRMKEVLDEDDFQTAVYLKDINQIFSLQSVFSIPFKAPEELEGVKNPGLLNLLNCKQVVTYEQASKMLEKFPGDKVPETDATKNAHIEKLTISLTPGKDVLSLQRTTVLKGNYKYDVQKDLILYEDLYESERKELGEKKTLLEWIESKRKGKKLVDEVRNALDDARKKQVDAFKAEAKSWFEQDITDFKNYRIDNMGVRHTKPDFEYSSSFDMNGLVKKAGNNLIVEIGKIQGTPLEIKAEQRNRDLDVYMNYPRSIEYHINFKIPEGYTIQGNESINRKVQNETGFFIVESNIQGSNLIIKVKKHYLNYFEPAQNWRKMAEFLDAAVEWTNAKILLRKTS